MVIFQQLSHFLRGQMSLDSLSDTLQVVQTASDLADTALTTWQYMCVSFQKNFWNRHFVDLLGFALKVSGAAALFFILDYGSSKIFKRKSFLGIKYTKRTPIGAGAFWVFGAGVMGFMFAFLEIVNNNRYSIVTLGFGWPVLLTKLLNSKSEDDLRDGTDDDTETETSGVSGGAE